MFVAFYICTFLMGFVYIHTLLGRGACGEPEPPAVMCQGHRGHHQGQQGRAGPGVAPAFFIMIMIIIRSIIIFSRHVHF